MVAQKKSLPAFDPREVFVENARRRFEEDEKFAKSRQLATSAVRRSSITKAGVAEVSARQACTWTPVRFKDFVVPQEGLEPPHPCR